MSLAKSDYAFCQGCGESVETHRVMAEGKVESRCVYCGLVLDEQTKLPEACDRVIVVDDSRTICDVVSDALMQRGIASEVSICHDGREFIREFTQSLVAQRPPNYVILDVELPIVNGIQAAIAGRAIEEGFGIQSIPFIFFSVRKCDENFRKVLQLCKPAAYLNKATAPKSEMIGDRLSAIMRDVGKKID